MGVARKAERLEIVSATLGEIERDVVTLDDRVALDLHRAALHDVHPGCEIRMGSVLQGELAAVDPRIEVDTRLVDLPIGVVATARARRHEIPERIGGSGIDIRILAVGRNQVRAARLVVVTGKRRAGKGGDGVALQITAIAVVRVDDQITFGASIT